MPGKDFILIYDEADKAWAQWIDWQLQRKGYSVFTEAYDLKPGNNRWLALDKALTNANRALALFSKTTLIDAQDSVIFQTDPDGSKARLIPVRIAEIELQGLLRGIKPIDLFALDENAAIQRLAEGVSVGDRRPQQAPSFPGISPSRFPGASNGSMNQQARSSQSGASGQAYLEAACAGICRASG
jgi:hypothetical protein